MEQKLLDQQRKANQPTVEQQVNEARAQYQKQLQKEAQDYVTQQIEEREAFWAQKFEQEVQKLGMSQSLGESPAKQSSAAATNVEMLETMSISNVSDRRPTRMRPTTKRHDGSQLPNTIINQPSDYDRQSEF